MNKTKWLKSANDFIIGVALLGVGLFVLLTKHLIQGRVETGDGGFFVRADVYVRIIGALMAFFSAVLIAKSVNWKKGDKTQGFSFVVRREIVLTMIALILYVFFLPIVHFFLSTFVLSVFLTYMYIAREASGAEQERPDKRKKIRRLIIAAVYSVLLVLFVHVIFSYVLKVTLP